MWIDDEWRKQEARGERRCRTRTRPIATASKPKVKRSAKIITERKTRSRATPERKEMEAADRLDKEGIRGVLGRHCLLLADDGARG